MNYLTEGQWAGKVSDLSRNMITEVSKCLVKLRKLGQNGERIESRCKGYNVRVRFDEKIIDTYGLESSNCG